MNLIVPVWEQLPLSGAGNIDIDSQGETFTTEEWSPVAAVSMTAATVVSNPNQNLSVISITPRLCAIPASEGDSEETGKPGRADDTLADPWNADIARLGLRGGDRRLNKVTTIHRILRSNIAAPPAAAHLPAKPADVLVPEAQRKRKCRRTSFRWKMTTRYQKCRRKAPRRCRPPLSRIPIRPGPQSRAQRAFCLARVTDSLGRCITRWTTDPRNEGSGEALARAGGEQPMHEPLDTAEIPLPLSMVVRIDQICDRFEAAWNTVAPGGPGPQIDDYLGDTPEPERGVVLRHLVALDLDYRRRHGETPLPSDYQRRYPGLSDRLLADLLTLPASGSSVVSAAEEKAAAAPLGAAANPVLDLSTIDLPPPSAPLLRSNRYVIRQFHARGGTSEIWLALDAEIGRQVAVKKLDKKHATDQDRFLVEAQVTGQLEHPGIVPVHDLGRDKQGRPFYVMTFIQGRTLKEAIEEYHTGKSSTDEAAEVRLCRLLEVFVQVCQAVAYAHSRGVIHRDLKPSNVMLGPYGETLVLDWGMAKVLGKPERPVAMHRFGPPTQATRRKLRQAQSWVRRPTSHPKWPTVVRPMLTSEPTCTCSAPRCTIS